MTPHNLLSYFELNYEDENMAQYSHPYHSDKIVLYKGKVIELIIFCKGFGSIQVHTPNGCDTYDLDADVPVEIYQKVQQ